MLYLQQQAESAARREQQQADNAARREEQMAQMHMQLQQQQAAFQQEMARMSAGMQGTTASAASTGEHVQQLLSALVKGNDKGLMGEREELSNNSRVGRLLK